MKAGIRVGRYTSGLQSTLKHMQYGNVWVARLLVLMEVDEMLNPL